MLLSKQNRILKNVLVVSIAFLLEFTAYGGIANLQSTLNSGGDLGAIGTNSSAIIYAALVFSSLFLSNYILELLGLKKALMLSLCGYVLYSVANFYVSEWTLYPAAVILGLCGAPLWAAKASYITTSAQKYVQLSDDPNF